jgi:D-glycero-D-manno-heptose 1,7-bisphosphate phosphatase
VDLLRPAVFLDRDGTLNCPPAPGEYVLAPEGVALLEGAGEAVALLANAGYARVVVSNQRGVALGLLTEAELDEVDARLRDLLAEQDASLDASYYCMHGLEDGCGCRKPQPGLLLQAAEELGLDLARSWMVGDSEGDLEAGRRAGCAALRVEPRDGALLGAARSIVGAVR